MTKPPTTLIQGDDLPLSFKLTRNPADTTNWSDAAIAIYVRLEVRGVEELLATYTRAANQVIVSTATEEVLVFRCTVPGALLDGRTLPEAGASLNIQTTIQPSGGGRFSQRSQYRVVP